MIFNYDDGNPERLANQEDLLAHARICPENSTLRNHAISFRGMVSNLPIFTLPKLGYGSFNFFPDPDGTSRRSALALRIGDHLYPSLALATLSKALNATPHCIASPLGFQAIVIDKYRVPVTSRRNAFSKLLRSKISLPAY